MSLSAMSGQCASCPVQRGECPACGTFWWVRGDSKRFGMRPATEQDAAIIRSLQTKHGSTAYPVFPKDLPNAIFPAGFREAWRR